MTRIRDRAGYGRPLPARVWLAGAWLLPRWMWVRHPAMTCFALAAAAVLVVGFGGAAVLDGAGQQCHHVPSKYARDAGTCR